MKPHARTHVRTCVPAGTLPSTTPRGRPISRNLSAPAGTMSGPAWSVAGASLSVLRGKERERGVCAYGCAGRTAWESLEGATHLAPTLPGHASTQVRAHMCVPECRHRHKQHAHSRLLLQAGEDEVVEQAREVVQKRTVLSARP